MSHNNRDNVNESPSKGVYAKIVFLAIFTVMAVSFSNIGYSDDVWWNPYWDYRKSITINSTFVDDDFINFPILLDLTDMDLANKAQSDADDISFADINGVKLSHEIESYNSVTGHILAWVKIPVINSSSDTIFYMYYGNSQASNQENAEGVWDDNYKMVQHLDEISGVHYDSTEYNNDGAALNGVNQSGAGYINGCDVFDGSDDFLNVSQSSTLSGFTQGFTVSAWVKLNDIGRRQTILSKYETSGDQRSWYVGLFNDTVTGYGYALELFTSENGTDVSYWRALNNFTTGWHYVTYVWESNVVPSFYLDGVKLNTWGNSTISSIYSNISPLQIGKNIFVTGREVNGSIDEVRISDIARSSEWIAFEYLNHNETFFPYIGGSEELVNALTISTSSDPNGAINPSGSVLVAFGSNQTFEIIPDNGYHISDVVANGSSVGPVSEYTFVNVTANGTIEAQFAANVPPIVSTSKSSYNRGEIITITVTGGTSNDVVMLQINDPSKKVWADQRNFASDGSFSYQLKIPQSWVYGTYTIIIRDFSSWTTRTKTFTVASPPSPPPPPPRPPRPPIVSPSNIKPIPDAGRNQTIFINRTLYFNASASSDADGTITDYLWIFGDNSPTSDQPTTSHVYSEVGIYTVQLIVFDNNGASASDIIYVTVIDVPLDPEMGLDEGVPPNQIDYEIDATDVANTTITLNTTDHVTITVLQYPSNPYPEVPLPEFSLSFIVDIAVSDPDAINWPIHVEYTYSDDDVLGLNETRLVLYYYREGEWHVCRETGVYSDLNIVWANMYEDELTGSPLIVGEPPIPAYFIVSDLDVSPSEVEPSQSVNVTVSVENIGREEGIYNLTLWINGAIELVESIPLPGENSTSLSFLISRDDEGSYTVEIDDLESVFNVILLLPAEFEISDLTITPNVVEPGEDIEVSVEVTNVGMKPGSTDIIMEIDQTEVDSEAITLEDGETIIINFIVSSEDEGVHTLSVNGVTGTFTVAIPLAPAEFNYEIVNVIPSEIEPGDTVTINVKITNTGEERGTYTFDLILDESTIDSETGELNGGEDRLLSLSVSSDDEGSHIIAINGATDTFFVNTTPDTEERKLPWLWIDLFIIVVVSATIYVLRKRGRI